MWAGVIAAAVAALVDLSARGIGSRDGSLEAVFIRPIVGVEVVMAQAASIQDHWVEFRNELDGNFSSPAWRIWKYVAILDPSPAIKKINRADGARDIFGRNVYLKPRDQVGPDGVGRFPLRISGGEWKAHGRMVSEAIKIDIGANLTGGSGASISDTYRDIDGRKPLRVGVVVEPKIDTLHGQVSAKLHLRRFPGVIYTFFEPVVLISTNHDKTPREQRQHTGENGGGKGRRSHDPIGQFGPIGLRLFAGLFGGVGIATTGLFLAVGSGLRCVPYWRRFAGLSLGLMGLLIVGYGYLGAVLSGS